MFAWQCPHRWQSSAVALAVSHRLRLTVAQQPIEEKSNEIPALEPLLRKLPQGALEGSLITADAMQCQQESSRLVTQELGADYLWGLKGNQSGILERRKNGCPKIFFPSEYDTGWTKEHGRLVRWRLQRVTVSPEEAGLCGCWQFLAVAPTPGTAPGQSGRDLGRVRFLLHQRRPQPIHCPAVAPSPSRPLGSL